MKTILLFFTLSFVSVINAQNNCSQFYLTKKGTKATIHHYNQKDKLTSKTTYQVIDINSSGSDTKITMGLSMKEGKKDKVITEAQFDITCDGGTTHLDPQSIISPKILDQYKEMEYTIEGDNISIPNSLSVGQKLKDGHIAMAINAGVISLDIKIDIADRKVEAKETITTSAGSFDCYVISYTNNMNMSMGVSHTYHIREWIAKEVGMVQQETKKTNGKLVGKSILQQLN